MVEITYAGTVQIDPSNDGKADPVPTSVSITIQGSRITNYVFFGSLRCTDGGRANVGVIYAQLSTAPIAFTGRRFAVTVGNPGKGFGLVAQLTGSIIPGHAITGRISITSHEDGGAAPAGPLCTSAYGWIAKAQPPPQPPEPSVSVAFFQARMPSADGNRYAFGVGPVTCENGALAVQITLEGQTTAVPCTAQDVILQTNLTPGRAYSITMQPLVRRNGRLVPAGHKQTSVARIPD